MLKITLEKNVDNSDRACPDAYSAKSGSEMLVACPKCNSEDITKFYCKKCFWHFPKMKKGGKLHKGKNKLTRSLNSRAIAEAHSSTCPSVRRGEVEMNHFDDNEGLPYEF